jgi:hypothetical protein
MLSHVARVSLFQNINERRENLCLEFFLDKIEYAVFKYLIILIKFIVISSKLSSKFLIYFLIKKIRLYLEYFFLKNLLLFDELDNFFHHSKIILEKLQDSQGVWDFQSSCIQSSLTNFHQTCQFELKFYGIKN